MVEGSPLHEQPVPQAHCPPPRPPSPHHGPVENLLSVPNFCTSPPYGSQLTAYTVQVKASEFLQKFYLATGSVGVNNGSFDG